ncbi:MAG TPA: 4Fe-4S binding protein [Vicinamibacterales bacterium]|nr:4Fe-4S binding protein [Vicinamibacterales bacterium]
MRTKPEGVAPVTFYKSTPLASSPGGALRSLAPAQPCVRSKKPYTRRTVDNSQRIRSAVQIAFGAVAVVVGVQFYFWVRYYETQGQAWKISRPPGVEAWLPIASLMNLKDFLLTGTIAEVHPAGMFMLVAFVAISWVYRKSFCSWICPVGTLSEWLWKGGEATFGRNLALPRWFDVPLRSLKYILFALFAYVVVTMPVPEIRAFLNSPYGLMADVKMLDFFRRMGQTTAAVLALLLILSVVVKNFWCRYLCPYGALTGLVALASPTRIRRNPVACIDCAKCAKACPAGLPVDTALSIRSAECTACMSCVSVCPAVGALDLRTGLGRHVAVPPWALATAIGIIFLGIAGYARLAGHWHTSIPEETLFELIPRAGEFAHPR